MALPSLDDHYRAITRFTNVPGGRPFTVSIDFVDLDKLGNLAPQLAEGLLENWGGWFASIVGGGVTPLSDYIMPTVAVSSVLVYDLGSADEGAERTPSTPIVGTAGGTDRAMPPDIAVVVSKRSGFRGRAGSGRFYMGGWAEQIMDGASGLLEPTFTQGLEQISNDSFLGAPGTFTDADLNGIRAAIISQKEGLPDISRVVQTFTVDTHVDVQRRRGIR